MTARCTLCPRCRVQRPSDFLDEIFRWFESLPNIHMPGGQPFGKTSPAPRCLKRRDLRGTGSYTAWHPRRQYNTAQTHRTRGWVSSVTYRHTTAQTHTAHFHLRTMTIYTSQDSCRTTYGPQICPPKWTVLLVVTAWPNQNVTRRYGDRILRALCCGEWQFCHPTWQHGLPQEIQKMHIFGDYLEECTW